LDAVAQEAIDGLSNAITQLMQAAGPLAPAPTVLVVPKSISLTGLGGLVATNESPLGDIVGRRVSADVRITARGTTPDSLDASVTSITRALLTAGRSTLLEKGIVGLDLDETGPRMEVPAQNGGSVRERELSFRLLYEYLKKPEEDEGIIQTIPLNINVG
jgi:hypothetical protein